MPIRQKILYISWSVPPTPGGSAYIVHQLVKNFDCNNIVIAGGSRSPFQGAKEYDGVKYHYFFTEFNLRGHGDRYFSVLRWFLFPLFLFNLFLLTRKEKPTSILATFPDGYYLLGSLLIARIFKLNYFSYFHNTYVENRHGLSKWFATKIQKGVFQESKIIFTMSEGMQDYYQRNYPEYSAKFKVLPHTFDKYPEINKFEKRIGPAIPYKLIMIGTFNDSNMEATRRLLHLISKYPELYQLDIYTSTNKQILKYKWGLDLESMEIHHKGFVKQEEVNAVIAKYDACILTHGFVGGYTDTEYETIFPTRTIPLLISNKPILAHSPQNSFLNKFITKYDCAELVSEKSDSKLLEALEKVTTDQYRIQQLVENAKKVSAYFYGPDVNRSLISQIGADFMDDDGLTPIN